MRVLVVGAGPAGCTAAVALAGRGAEVELLEAEAGTRPSGPGLVLQSAPMRVLDSLGLLEDCLERGYAHEGIDVCDAGGTVRGPARALPGADHVRRQHAFPRGIAARR